MKSERLRIIVILLFIPVLFSCEQELKPDEQLEITKETLNAKWLVSGTDGIYESFGDAYRVTVITLTENDLVVSYKSPEGNTNTEYYVPLV